MARPQLWAEASRRLLDFTRERLPEMDRFGLDAQLRVIWLRRASTDSVAWSSNYPVIPKLG